MTIDYQVVLIHFPSRKVKESVVENEDGSYTVFIESSLSREMQNESFKHAMRHILGNDFSKRDADRIEFAVHSA